MDSCGDQDQPGSRWDYALFAAAMAASLVFIVANVVVLLHRKRRYFRAQGGALLILTSSLAGLIWIAATFVTNLHFPRKRHFLLICPLWSFWLRLTFGFWLWLACQILRLLHLHYLCQSVSVCFTSVHSSRCRTLFCVALLLWTPGLAFAIVATATHASVPWQEGDDCANCELRGLGKLCSFLVLPSIYFTILIILLFNAKRNQDYMMVTECSHTFEYSLVMALVIYLSYGAALLTESQKKIPGRCFLTFCVCCIVFVNFWVRLGWPVYLCLCKSKSEMDSFEEELRSCGAECLDQLSAPTNISRAARRSSSARQYGDWILRAIDAAMNEVSECKEKINQLEQRKAVLSAKINHLEVSASAKFLPS